MASNSERGSGMGASPEARYPSDLINVRFTKYGGGVSGSSWEPSWAATSTALGLAAQLEPSWLGPVTRSGQDTTG